MKSKSFELKQNSSDKKLDFVKYYKSNSENTTQLIENQKPNENLVNKTTKTFIKDKKKRKKLELEHIDPGPGAAMNSSLNISNNNSKTSTPLKKSINGNLSMVKSIMKNSSQDDCKDNSDDQISVETKRKKRNKSVSFILEDTEVAVKKARADEKVPEIKTKKKKTFKNKHQEKENRKNIISDESDLPQNSKKKNRLKKKKHDSLPSENNIVATSDSNEINNEENVIKDAIDNKNKTNKVIRAKSLKKKKFYDTKNIDNEGEPLSKTKKKDIPEVIAENLENLSIGENPHTLTNLLDKMTVSNKTKKNKHKKNKKSTNETNTSSSENVDLEKIEEGKEKIKWKNRKWNKDRKGELNEDYSHLSVIVDNLPLSIMLNYKKILSDKFSIYGVIKKVGVAEIYSCEEAKQVFSTCIYFQSEEDATKALREDTTLVAGNSISVKRPLPPSETSVFVRSYGDLTEQNLGTVFSTVGKIRSIRLLVKGKKTMASAIVEFDGPKAVKKALKMAVDSRIGGKKMHVSKYELKLSNNKKIQQNSDTTNDGDCETSN